MGVFEGDRRAGPRGVRESAPEGDPIALAQGLLARGRVFEGEAHARRSIEHALLSRDFACVAGLARILRAAREEIRSRALGAEQTRICESLDDLADEGAPGCVLIQPPLIGAQGRAYRDLAWARGVAVMVICREPRTSAGLWPLVAVGRSSYRVRVEPPAGAREKAGTLRGDVMDVMPTSAWFVEAAAHLGRAIIARVARVEHAAWRTEDLVDAVLAHPEDGSIHDALEDAALDAARTPLPQIARPLADYVDRPSR